MTACSSRFPRPVATPCLLAIQRRGISFPASWSFAEPNGDHSTASLMKLFCQFGVVIVRPTFCRAKFRAGVRKPIRTFEDSERRIAASATFRPHCFGAAARQRLRPGRRAHHAHCRGPAPRSAPPSAAGVFIRTHGAIAHFAAPASTVRDIGRKESAPI